MNKPGERLSKRENSSCSEHRRQFSTTERKTDWKSRDCTSICPSTHPPPTQLRAEGANGKFTERGQPPGLYKIGQLYMISKHSHEQSDRGEGVEVVQNEPFEDPHHGNGQFTEKRVYLNSKLPSWARAVVPKIFYVTEKAWNYYPYTITGKSCSFLPKFSIHIETKYEDNKGSNDRIFDNEAKDLEREVCFIDIACDEIPERYYKESEDPKHFKSEKTGRGQLREGWRDSHQPIMCSYKLVTVKFEVWGLQTRVEQFVHKVVRDILLIGHRQAFAWVDEWYDMTMDDVREYEKNMHEQTNIKVCNQHSSTVDDIESHAQTST
ncbi:cytoplasmic phosphatidylinositol transfer protein 1 isoform X5 [Acinonyx jubatus]|uniref:Cytoplasmic phosphatidylinositol transfer protein 1 isoform X5 n=1 Tax=Acinonyx jubatus TaxID=32536 RepID=A0ABM3P7W1_ACIJB|nr:cytoplasmic phosphatidylinositol transfer protein 1 isoform X5 [Acinonyx jubatus]